MTTLRVVVAPDPDALLVSATEGLFPLPVATTDAPWPTLSAWVALRQGGLRDDFHALAARAGVAGWFDPPVCLFSELAARWGDGGDTPLSNEERLALLTGILGARGVGVFDRSGGSDGWVPGVDRLLRELVGEGISPAAFRAALDGAAGRDAFERRRDDALANVYDDWCAALQRRQRTDGRDALVRLAQAITSNPEGFAQRLGGRRDVRIVGLADLRGGWAPLLRALTASPALDRVSLIVSHSLRLPPDLATSTIVLPGRRPLARALFADVASEADGRDAVRGDADHDGVRIALLEAPDVAREGESIAVRVRALIDGGAEPSRIGVFFRQARPGVDAVADALRSMGVPVTARRRTALSEAGPARALCALLNLVVNGWSRHAVLEVAEHPLLPLALDSAVLDAAARAQVVASLDDWLEALTALHGRCLARDARERAGRITHRNRAAVPPTPQVEATLVAWRAWLPTASLLTQSHTMRDWFAWVREVLVSDAWGMNRGLVADSTSDMGALRASVRARDAIARLAADWHGALEAFGVDDRPIDATVFVSRLSLLLASDLITQPETGYGVVVSEALAGAWRSFDHVFVAGLSAGAFPQRATASTVLTDADRHGLIAAGLPLDAPEAWRDREQELFRVLCAAPRHTLTLSWPAMDADGREVVRSAYVDAVADILLQMRGDDREEDLETDATLVRMLPQQVFTPGFPILPRAETARVLAHAQQAAATEAARSRLRSPWNGEIQDVALREMLAGRFDESYVWSATQLEGLAKCAWSWLADRLLALGERVEASDAIDPSVTGMILHDALDRFFAGARATRGEPAVFLRTTDRAWAIAAANVALDEAWRSLGADEWLGHPAFHDLVRGELSALVHGYLDFEMTFNDKSYDNRTTSSKQIRMGAAEGERRFDNVPLTGDGLMFRLRGTVDRVDRGVDERLGNPGHFVAAIDYKSSIYATPGGGHKSAWDDGVVLQVPLYAAVLREQFRDATLARLEYRTLRKPKAVHSLQFVGVVKGDGRGADASFSAAFKPDAERQLTEALDAAGRRVRAVRLGQLPAAPVPSCGCSPYCPARDICRIPGGPVEGVHR